MRLRIVAAGACLALYASVVGTAAPASADTFVPISGAGSTWAQNAIEQWRKNVNPLGLRVNYAGTGSSDGRNQFRNGTVDFAVSEVPYGLTDSGVTDTPPARGFAYLPVVGGGTALMYNLVIDGARVTQLRLSDESIAKIFTRAITSWADPQIAEENPGLDLPALPVVPVVRYESSGSSAQFTAYLAAQQPDRWNSYCSSVGRPTPCGATSVFPVAPGGGIVAQAGSLGVSGYVSQSQNEGTITYVEYSYAVNAGFPTAKVLNDAGYYVAPTASNVAVGLLGARVRDDVPVSDPAYLTQDLSGVYSSTDQRAYPLSSYSYLIVPAAVEGTFTADKGRSLGAFAYYALCEGQQQASRLGYSPLPINLVRSGLDQVARIPGVVSQTIDIATCNNPTFSADGTNTLANNAPYPPDCDAAGPLQCGTDAVYPRFTQAPSISGSPRVGRSLTCTASATPSSSLEYAWFVSGTTSTRAAGRTLQLGERDYNRTVVCTATARNAAGPSSATSAPVRVQAGPPLTVIARPTLAGKAKLGRNMRVKSSGIWAPAATTVTFRWFRVVGGNLVPIKSATRPVLKLTRASKVQNHRVVVRVSGARTGRVSGVAYSRASARVR